VARYIIERQYLVPVYEHILVEAPNFEAACRKALDDIEEPWGDNVETDYEGARPTTIERAVEVLASTGSDESSLSRLLYDAGLDLLPIPREFTDESDGPGAGVGFT
jgi:hypothetical protein